MAFMAAIKESVADDFYRCVPSPPTAAARTYHPVATVRACGSSDDVISELRNYRSNDRERPAEGFPYRLITSAVQLVGRHFLPSGLLAELALVRDEYPGESLLGDFLNCVLDKYDNTYRYSSYIAFPVLAALIKGETPQLQPAELTELLVADAIRFEVAALHGWHDGLPELRPSAAVVRKRARHGLRHLVRTGRAASHPELFRLADRVASAECARELLDALPEPRSADVALRLYVSVLPVHVLHDEYLFIRVLQSYETVFAAMVGYARAARDALQSSKSRQAAERVADTARCLDSAGQLFSLLATMSCGAFRTFREFTEGASAIQSEHYKEFELICGMPPADRLRSAAFGNVPLVQAAARSTPGTIATAYLSALEAGRLSAGEDRAMAAALAELERGHQRWKATHHSLAARMLGNARGSGYTAGVPYLKACLNNRLFWELPAVAGTKRAATTWSVRPP
jgi:tryptophan 2,3-dioxygenase